MNEKLNLHDTCGVHNLHGMPGLLGAIAGVVASKLADREDYKERYVLFVDYIFLFFGSRSFNIYTAVQPRTSTLLLRIL